MSPLPRRSAVTSGVPSASRAQVLPARPGSGSASTWRETVTSSGAARPKNGLSRSKGARRFGVSQDKRAAERAAAAPQRGRRQIVGGGGEPRAGEADEHAAVLDEFDRARRAPARRRRSYRRAPAPPAFRRAARRSGSLALSRHSRTSANGASARVEIVGRRQQRLRDIGAGARGDRHAPALPALVEQRHGAGRALVGDGDARRPRCAIRSADRISRVGRRCAAEIERRLADRQALGVERAQQALVPRAVRRRAARAPASAPARLSTPVRPERRVLSVSTLTRCVPGERGEFAREGAGAAELEAVGDPDDFGVGMSRRGIGGSAPSDGARGRAR